jgi:putative hemolysin
MKLIERQDLIQASNLGSLPAAGLSSVLMSTLKINKLNQLYSNTQNKVNSEFLDSVLGELEVRYHIDESDLKKIPKSGAFITVSNHPFGGIDGLLLLKIIGMVREDFKLMGNFLLQRIEPLKDKILPVNPFEQHQNLSSSISGIKQAYKHLSAGQPLGVFPAGEVSSMNEKIVVQDRQWVESAVKFIKYAEVPVVPIYFHGSNSTLFHLLGMLNPLLRTAKLPSELFNKKNKVINVRIGSPISVEEQSGFNNFSRFGRYLRSRTYALGSALEVKKFFQQTITKSDIKEKIAAPVRTERLKEEIENLGSENLLFVSGEYSVFNASATEIPFVLNEIGRLREETFREIGEGTNNSSDLDEFDLYYEHLFIWDNKNEQIVGSYRIAKGKEICRFFGKKGFYINSLFHIEKEFLSILEKSIELGRSFVVKEYQKKPKSLFLLWKGILHVLFKNPEYRYLIGPVSISNTFSNISKSLIIDFIEKNHFRPEYASYIRPRKKFKVNYGKVDQNIMMDSINGNIDKLDKMIQEIEPEETRMPILFKKYLKQNAKIIGFNVDPRFNQALDGLMLLDLFDVPTNTVRALSKEMRDHSIMERFYSQFAVEEYSRVPQL